jgi:heme-degrading monooxygenase HmoA
MSVTTITCVSVEPDRGGEFVGAWPEVLDGLRRQPGYLSHRLHRSLAPDAPFRYVVVAQWQSDQPPTGAIEDSLREVQDPQAFRAFSGRYEVVHSSGPATGRSGAGDAAPAAFVNCFEVEPGREDEAFARWQQVNAYMVAKPGFISHRLHRSLGADARFRFVNVASWQSTAQWQAAHDEGFRALVSGPLPFVSVPALFEVIDEGAATPAEASA